VGATGQRNCIIANFAKGFSRNQQTTGQALGTEPTFNFWILQPYTVCRNFWQLRITRKLLPDITTY